MNNKERQKQYQEKYKRDFSRKWFEYCKEPLEDIERWSDMLSDNSGQRWCMHHRDEIQSNGGVVSKDELKSRGVYKNLPANKLIFLTESEHMCLHKCGDKHHMHGKHHSEESKNKISEKMKGKFAGDKHPMHGKHHSEESKNKISESFKGGKHPSSKPIEIDGIPYVSRKAAEKTLRVSNRTMRNWLQEGRARYI